MRAKWMKGVIGCFLATSFAACSDDKDGDAQATDTGVDTGGGAETTVAPDTAETSGGLTWDDIYPIFHDSCVPCHRGSGTLDSGSGGHSIGSDDKAVAYDASQKAVSANAPTKCKDLKIVQCAILRIKDGSMPASGECAANPPEAKCPTVDEQAQIQAWIDAGMPE